VNHSKKEGPARAAKVEGASSRGVFAAYGGNSATDHPWIHSIDNLKYDEKTSSSTFTNNIFEKGGVGTAQNPRKKNFGVGGIRLRVKTRTRMILPAMG